MKSNKVGIATWHKNGNYGGTLQAYAMSETYKKLGLVPEFINYNPAYKKFSYKIIRRIKNFLIFLRYPTIGFSREKIYQFVKKEMLESPNFYNYDQLREYAENNYAFASCGSDQIWSVFPDREIKEFYFLTFISKDKRLSYAPSIGLQEVPAGKVSYFGKLVGDIPFLSVREENGKRIIQEVSGREAAVVLDPCLLLSQDEWLSKLQPTRIVKPKYIFCYFLRNKKNHIEFANKLSQRTGYQIISVQTKREGVLSLNNKIVDPLGFVSLVRDAEYVLTDSFHGSVFSFILKKHLGMFLRFNENELLNQNSRIYNLLSIIKDDSCIIKDNTDIDTFLNNSIDYQKVHIELDKARKNSLLFLEESISKICNQANK